MFEELVNGFCLLAKSYGPLTSDYWQLPTAYLFSFQRSIQIYR